MSNLNRLKELVMAMENPKESILEIANNPAIESKFLGIFESAPDGIVLIGSDGKIVMSNVRMVELFGYARAELIGKPIEILLPAELTEVHQSHRAKYFSSPKSRTMGSDLKITGKKKDGSIIPLDVAISYVETEEGILGMAFVRERKI